MSSVGLILCLESTALSWGSFRSPLGSFHMTQGLVGSFPPSAGSYRVQRFPMTPRQLLARRLRQEGPAPSRTDVRTVKCPYCAAEPCSPCIGRRGKIRTSNHAERVETFLAGYRPQVGGWVR